MTASTALHIERLINAGISAGVAFFGSLSASLAFTGGAEAAAIGGITAGVAAFGSLAKSYGVPAVYTPPPRS